MRLYIIRHGHVTYRRGIPLDSVPPEERSYLPDPALTEVGRKQAVLLGEHLSRDTASSEQPQPPPMDRSGFAITRLFCSPMRRALQTAQPVAAALGLRAEIWLDLHELGGIRHDEGDGQGARSFSGLSRAEVEQSFPGFVIPEDFADTGWWDPPPEGDQYLARLERVVQALRAMARTTDEHIALITHGSAASCLLHALLGSNAHEDFDFNHSNTGITSLTFRENQITLRYQNRLEHLPDDLLTK